MQTVYTKVELLHVLTFADFFFQFFRQKNFTNKVRIGDSNHASDDDDKNAIDLEIIKYTQHPDFDEEAAYFDIAVVETKKVNFSKYIRPICLPDSHSEDGDKYKNNHVELTGWGQDNLHGQISEKLKRVSLQVFPTRYFYKDYQFKC